MDEMAILIYLASYTNILSYWQKALNHYNKDVIA